VACTRNFFVKQRCNFRASITVQVQTNVPWPYKLHWPKEFCKIAPATSTRKANTHLSFCAGCFRISCESLPQTAYCNSLHVVFIDQGNPDKNNVTWLFRALCCIPHVWRQASSFVVRFPGTPFVNQWPFRGFSCMFFFVKTNADLTRPDPFVTRAFKCTKNDIPSGYSSMK